MRETLVKSEEFKDSPLGKIPKDWEIVSLKNEINILHGYAFEGEYFADEPPGNVLLVPGNFHRDGGLYFDDNNTKYYRGLIPDGTVLENGQLLIVMTDLSPRTLILGRVVLLELPFRVLHNQRIGKIVLKLPDTWDKRFLLLVMNSDRVRRNIISNATGTTVRHTSPDRIIANVVPKPPVEEQSKIADILDTIDAAIAHTSSLIAKLKQMKAGLLHDLLTRGLDENGELRDAIAHPEQFKDSPLGQIPKDWDVCPLKALTDSSDSITYGVLKPGEYVSGGIPLLQIQDVIHGEIEPSKLHRISKELDAQYARTRLGGGEIVMSLVGTIGKIAQIPDSLAGANLHRNLARIPISLGNSSRFVFHYLQSQIVQEAIAATTFGSTQSLLNLTDLRELLIALPPSLEQQAIAKFIDTKDTCIRAEEAYRDKLKLQKQGLMHDLLTGKVRVKNA